MFFYCLSIVYFKQKLQYYIYYILFINQILLVVELLAKFYELVIYFVRGL